MPGYDADILVAGGGPAGLAAALYARAQGLSVVVADPRRPPIDKACGEGLMPGGLRALEALDVHPEGIPFGGIAYVNGDQRAEARFRDGLGLGIRRTTLHLAMADRAADAGAEWLSQKVSSVAQDRDGVTAAGLRVRYLVAADGLHSAVGREIGIDARVGTPRRFGVRRHYRVQPWSDLVEVHWSAWGEAYVTPVEPGLVGVAMLSSIRPQLNWFPRLAGHLDGAPQGRERGCGPMRRVVSRRVAGRVLFIGDAAGYEDALTGEGISLAIKQAEAAVAAITAEQPAGYERAWHRITRRYRVVTRALVLATRPEIARRAIVPACSTAPAAFGVAVNMLSY
jgi:flavin-dependent dehydrogenase